MRVDQKVILLTQLKEMNIIMLQNTTSSSQNKICIDICLNFSTDLDL